MGKKYNYEFEYDIRYCYSNSNVLKNKFCRTEFIEQQMQEIFEKLQRENYLQDVATQCELSKRLAYYLSEINAIHPFREGNGRCQECYTIAK